MVPLQQTHINDGAEVHRQGRIPPLLIYRQPACQSVDHINAVLLTAGTVQRYMPSVML
jgi:hypothetical protein